MSAGTVRERRADARTWAGFRSAHVARSMGTLVVVVDGHAAGIEDSGDPEALRWFTICDDHSRLVGHDTLKLARFHACAPEEWCDACGGQEPADDEEAAQ